MSFDFNEHQRQIPFENIQHMSFRVMPKLVCADGFSMSVQASETHYCEPRYSDMDFYYRVEVGYPSAREESLMEYCEDSNDPTHTVYGYVPVEVVNDIINAHGGLKSSNTNNPS